MKVSVGVRPVVNNPYFHTYRENDGYTVRRNVTFPITVTTFDGATYAVRSVVEYDPRAAKTYTSDGKWMWNPYRSSSLPSY